jgi:tetratricopeptide (TPR) repeat protein
MDDSPRPDHPAESHLHLGTVHLHRGNPGEAVRHFERAVDTARAAQHTSHLILSLGSLGNACALLGRRDDALQCYREVLYLQRRMDDRHAAGKTLANMGTISMEMEQHDRAEAYYLEALDLLNEIKDTQSIGILHGNLGRLAHQAGRTDEATGYFEQALADHRRVGNEEGLAATYAQFGEALLDSGRLRQAEQCFCNATEHYTRLGQELGERRMLLLLANLYVRQQDTERARRCLERAVVIGGRYNLMDAEDDRRRLAQLGRP